jgi:hypothetical protein
MTQCGFFGYRFGIFNNRNKSGRVYVFKSSETTFVTFHDCFGSPFADDVYLHFESSPSDVCGVVIHTVIHKIPHAYRTWVKLMSH